MTDTKLTKGQKYDLSSLSLSGWTEGNGTGHDGYNFSDYFRNGVYQGPDMHGIEPLFSTGAMHADLAKVLDLPDSFPLDAVNSITYKGVQSINQKYSEMALELAQLRAVNAEMEDVLRCLINYSTIGSTPFELVSKALAVLAKARATGGQPCA